MDFSIVEYYSSNGGSRCGYCSSSNSSISNGMWAYEMTVEDYQALIDRGWRRSGQYLYQPSLKETCCAMYTIKCGALEIKLSKSQKKILKRMTRFLSIGERFKSKNDGGGRSSMEGNSCNDDVIMETFHRGPRNSTNISIESVVPHNLSAESADQEAGSSAACRENPVGVESTEPCNVPTKKPKVTEDKPVKPGIGVDSQRPPCKKAKLLRLERRNQKLAERGEPLPQGQHQPKQQEKSIEDFLADPEPSIHRLRVKLVRSQLTGSGLQATFELELSLYQRYQMAIHGDPITKCSEHQFKRFLVNSPLKIDLVGVKSPAFQTTFRRSAALFAKYQKTIHHEQDSECGPDTFIDFLATSPLKISKPRNGPPHGYGSFHQQYWLDDKLIAVGVLDILPKCVSSVYFFYDPDYADLSLGTYGSIREVSFTRELCKSAPDLKWYYMGYYIHSCPKMRYKAGLCPSYLLCPETYSWHPVEKCVPLLDKSSYCRFESDPNVKDPDGDVNLDAVPVLWRRTVLSFRSYKTQCSNVPSDLQKSLKEYASLVGKKCAEKIVFMVT